MKAELSHSDARARLTALMDEPVSSPMEESLAEHLADCEACRRFADDLHRVRRSLRLQPIEPVPDLTEPIMGRIRATQPVLRRRRIAALRLRIATVAAVVGALAVLGASLPLGGPTQSASADEIAQRVRQAARGLSTYHAAFDIVERGWHADVPQRRFTAELWFRAPEDLRLVVHDRTDYPTGAWPRNDVTVIADSASYSIEEPYACPAEALPDCNEGTGLERRATVNRQPFDGRTVVPTDMIVPLDSLSSTQDVKVLGERSIAGRVAYALDVPYRQAWPLLASLQLGGSWAPITPEASVRVWVDRRTSFPLRFEVTDPSGASFRVTTTTFTTPRDLPDGLFSTDRKGVLSDGGFRTAPIPTRFAPTYTAGLEAYRHGRAGHGQVVLSYASGATWLKLIVGRDSSRVFDTAAEVVELSNGGRAFYLPASLSGARSLEILGARLRAHLTSNLPRDELLQVAGSLPIEGRAPRSFSSGGVRVERIAPAMVGAIDFAALPDVLPPHYELSSAYLSTPAKAAPSLIVYFHPRTSQLDPAGIRLVATSGVDVLAPSSEELSIVRVGSTLGRWSEERSELEWIDGGVYRSISAPSFDLGSVVAVARSLR